MIYTINSIENLNRIVRSGGRKIQIGDLIYDLLESNSAPPYLNISSFQTTKKDTPFSNRCIFLEDIIFILILNQIFTSFPIVVPCN